MICIFILQNLCDLADMPTKRKLIMKKVVIFYSTLIAAPFSIKNKEKKRNSEAKITKEEISGISGIKHI